MTADDRGTRGDSRGSRPPRGALATRVVVERVHSLLLMPAPSLLCPCAHQHEKAGLRNPACTVRERTCSREIPCDCALHTSKVDVAPQLHLLPAFFSAARHRVGFSRRAREVALGKDSVLGGNRDLPPAVIPLSRTRISHGIVVLFSLESAGLRVFLA